MLDKENLKFVKNILSVTNKNVELDTVDKIMTYARDEDYPSFFNTVLDCLDNDPTFRIKYLRILHSIKDNNQYELFKDIIGIKDNEKTVTELVKILPIIKAITDQNELDFFNSTLTVTNPTLDVETLYNILKTVKDQPELKEDIFDSFSDNQIASKTALLSQIDELNFLNKDSNVVIWGSWYGSILIPQLVNRVNKVVCMDIDEKPLNIAKNRFFTNYRNIDYVSGDVFENYKDIYQKVNLIINTSCEHMRPMEEWPWFRFSSMETDAVHPKGYADDKPHRRKVYQSAKLSSDCYFAFQSNNMFDIQGHINCVNSLEEFKKQLPERAEVLYEDEVADTRGTRYMLIGKFNHLV
tara:strand:+ start:19125 stop:20183 length:1059 start_codon:yes stop_codon:yes gene_type:complete